MSEPWLEKTNIGLYIHDFTASGNCLARTTNFAQPTMVSSISSARMERRGAASFQSARRSSQGIPSIEDVQEIIWKFASLPGDSLEAFHRGQIEAQGRIRTDGRIYATPEPKDILLFVCGGLGGLHALGLHSFGSSLAQTTSIATSPAQSEY